MTLSDSVEFPWFVCLVFNGTFSTNRLSIMPYIMLYHVVRNMSRRDGRKQTHNKTMKQYNKTTTS